jgi:hypothetical protein
MEMQAEDRPSASRNSPVFNPAGLNRLRASGSGQFSLCGLRCIKRQFSACSLYVIDLREESHGFVGGSAISWRGSYNGANRGLTETAIAEEEARLLRELAVHNPQHHGTTAAVVSEEQAVRQEKAEYIRFFVTDRHRPQDETVDRFVRFVLSLPDDVWLHFHCLGGSGRTTTFLLMYDMLHNAGEVSLNDILLRQNVLGGRDMFAIDSTNPFLHQAGLERLRFIQAFYDYCKEASPGQFLLDWSVWRNGRTMAR